MSIEDRAKSTAQDLEGKGQEAMGKVTGSSQDEVAGQAKQGAAKVGNAIEDAKDKIAEKAQELGDKVKDGIDNAKREMNK
ncbi:CsbD family protein [Chamaesiphon sp. OTE_20_metabat_361]|uniref:CsbD family protein n=1 Tax=Chamaesiphon sp. OTE_20_metabat_361 TaxID=2964689 RepID=UPI00286ABA80|nr:CsbD family protein [Chamaesiphon sp. OTE_20_metabat_361]